jgi:hypothetical protein
MIEFAVDGASKPRWYDGVWMQRKNKSRSNVTGVVFFLVVLFLVGLGIRLIGLDFGTPLIVHPDEENVVKSAVNFVPANDFEGVAYNRPAQVQVELNAIVIRLYSQLRWHVSMYETYYDNEFIYFVVARFLTAILGALIPVVAFFIGKQFKPDFSVAAGLIFCFFPSYIKHSHYVTPDISITLWTLLVTLFAICYAQGKSKIFLWLAVLFTAVNTADKYPGILSSLMVFGALILRFSAEKKTSGHFETKRFILTTFGSLIAFFGFLFLVAPNLYLHFDKVVEALIHESNPSHLGADNLPYHMLLLQYVKYFASYANWVLIGLVGAGTVGLVVTKQKSGLFFLYGIVYCLLLNVVGKYFERWALPMYTSPLLAASFGAAWLIDLIKSKRPILWLLRATLLVGLLLLALDGLTESVYLSLPDTRTVSQAFLDQNGIVKENSYFDGYTPFSPRDFSFTTDFDPDNPGNKQFAILSSMHYKRYFMNPERSVKEIEFYTKIRQNAQLIEEFKPIYTPVTISQHWHLVEHVFRRVVLKQPSTPYYNGPILEIYKFPE